MVEARGGRDAAQPRAERRVAAVRRQAAQRPDRDLLEHVVHELAVAQHTVGDHAQAAIIVPQDGLEGPRSSPRRAAAMTAGPTSFRLLSLIHISEPTRLGMISYA